MNDLLLPKQHFSWSQYDLWKKNKERYIREYFAGGKRLDTRFLQFGKKIARMIEDGKIGEVLPDLQVYDEVEKKIALEIRGVPILSYLDSYGDSKGVYYHCFREYKTGKNPWDQVKVQKHGQLVFYAVALRALTGEMPWYCDLDWIETSDEAADPNDFWSEADKELHLTGKITSYRRHFDVRELDNMEADIVKVAHEISEAYKKFISEL